MSILDWLNDKLRGAVDDDRVSVPNDPSTDSPPRTSKRNYDDVHTAVMRAMWPLPEVNSTFVTEKDLPRIAEARKKTQWWRDWVARTELDSMERRAYLEWCDYCDHCNDDAEKEAVYGYERKSHEEWCEENRKKDARVDHIVVRKPETK